MRRSFHSFAFFIKERSILCVLYKRMRRSLRSFVFFIKERGVLCVLLCSEEKNAKERIVLLGFISRQKLEKRTLRALKECKTTMRSERKRTKI